MSVVGVGIDLVDVGEFAEQCRRPGTEFEQNFTPGERRDSRGPRGLAVRWAAKEAVIKAWSVSRFAHVPAVAQVRPREIEVVSDVWGRPSIRFSGAIAEHLDAAQIHISLTHDGDIAAAVAIIESSAIRDDGHAKSADHA